MKLTLVLTSILLCSFAVRAEKKDLLDLPQVNRQELLSQAKVFKASNGKIDIAEHMTKECGYPYLRDASGKIIRPSIECSYIARDPANPFGGMMAKFDCQIQPEGKDKFKTKVKYDPKHREGGGSKEVPQAVLGTLLTRVMGIEGNLYCPVDLTCINCPSKDPWAQGRSQVAGVEGNRIEFKNVVIEKKMKGQKILQSNPKLPTHPKAFTFAELLSTLPAQDKAAALADREALAIWVNFFGHGDAGAYNMALTCHGGSEVDGKPICEKVTASINDFGDAFGYHGMDRKMELSRFKSAAGVRASQNANEMFTDGAKGNSGPAGLRVSPEGVRKFVEAISQVSDQQLSDILDLAQIETVSDSSKKKWMETFHRKIEDIRNEGR